MNVEKLHPGFDVSDVEYFKQASYAKEVERAKQYNLSVPCFSTYEMKAVEMERLLAGKDPFQNDHVIKGAPIYKNDQGTSDYKDALHEYADQLVALARNT